VKLSLTSSLTFTCSHPVHAADTPPATPPSTPSPPLLDSATFRDFLSLRSLSSATHGPQPAGYINSRRLASLPLSFFLHTLVGPLRHKITGEEHANCSKSRASQQRQKRPSKLKQPKEHANCSNRKRCTGNKCRIRVSLSSSSSRPFTGLCLLHFVLVGFLLRAFVGIY
jgi:hypothetical protein